MRTRPFRKLLVANRGEIACRVIRTAKRLGIATVAVHSDADARALHVREADETVGIGPAPSTRSYLSIEAILEAARRTGADAVHPGYGFLSENAGFARALEAQGVAFVGPPSAAIEAMGDKIASKRIAREAGVSTVPGHMGLVETTDEAVAIAARIGFPVMIKASAGGGGKGMRVAWNEAEARQGFASSRSEARGAFNDERIFIEKFVEEPRHIEIQVLGDRHGNLIHLGERECSIQRRNQKVVEEAPSPFLDARTRRAMGEEALALARAVGYHSAGTVEFIVDRDRRFFFLEMNTRLQVEHPVTELVTGLDLVEEMIRIAAGEPLRLRQDDVRVNGWAMESRLYAEDPYRGFLPSVGRLTRYREPAETPDGGTRLRVDSGVVEGGEIAVHYDPMIAKLCTWGDTREAAIAAMGDALDRFEIEGIGHNLPFLSVLMDHPRFRDGRLSTAFIAQEWPNGFEGAAAAPEQLEDFAAVAVFAHVADEARKASVPDNESPLARDLVAASGKENWPLTAEATENGLLVRFANGGTRHVSADWRPGAPKGSFAIDGTTQAVGIAKTPTGWRLRRRGLDRHFRVMRPRVFELSRLMPEPPAADTAKRLLCPMPGIVTSILVAAGDTVEAGQPLAIVEAMKMENVLKAERRAVVESVKAAIGQSLALDEVIMEFA